MIEELFSTAIKNQLDFHTKNISDIKELISTQPTFSEWKPITQKSKSSIGVYMILHKPTQTISSIGCGRIGNRKGRHLSVFRNGGGDITHHNGSTSGSITGRKMYEMDTDLGNWWFSYCEIPNSSLASEYERLLQLEIKPPFNNLSMGGK